MLIFGGRSGEHEVSLASARAIADALRGSGRYEVLPVGITREGRWISSGDPIRELESRARELAGSSLGDSSINATELVPTYEKLPVDLGTADVVFPVLHGPYGEDGTVQGMLGLDRKAWEKDREHAVREVESALGYPCFVKPSNLGSSVGINKATNTEELREALDLAAGLDRRIIVEQGVEAREIEVSVLGNEEPEVSVPGEIVVKEHEFYDYEAKYTEGGMELGAPARIPDDVASEVRRVARAAYTSIDAAGMARVDFFLERGTERLLLNEINTIPGFTPTSVYPKLWAASGLPYADLLDRLIRLALERHGASS